MKSLILFAYLITSQAFGAWPTQGMDDLARDAVKWDAVGQADYASDIIQHGLMISPYVIAVQQKRDWQEIGGIAGAQIVAGGVTQAGKVYFNRERPNKSDRRAFPSGHTSSAFTNAAIGCKLDPDFCAPGFVLAGSVAYLRMAADKHWLSDVMMGAVIGTASGAIIPGVVWGW